MPLPLQQRVIVYLSWTTLAAALALLGWVFWSLWWPFNPLTTNPGSYEVVNPGKTVARGETLLVRVDYCKHTSDTAQLDTIIEQEGRLLLLAPQYPAATTGCHDVVVGIATIPPNLALESTSAAGSGRAKLRVSYRFRINTLREVSYSYVTDEFVITP